MNSNPLPFYRGSGNYVSVHAELSQLFLLLGSYIKHQMRIYISLQIAYTESYILKPIHIMYIWLLYTYIKLDMDDVRFISFKVLIYFKDTVATCNKQTKKKHWEENCNKA